MPTTRADTIRAETFAQLKIHPGLVQALTARGIVTPTPIQAEVIPLLLDGRWQFKLATSSATLPASCGFA